MHAPLDSAILHVVCALDCPDTCSVLVHVRNHRAVKLRGNPRHPVTRGFLCAKMTRYLEREYSPDRLTDLGGGPTFHSCLVEVKKCKDE